MNLASDSILKDDAALTEGTLSEKAKAIFAELDRSRILTVVRKGPHGVDGVNELLLKARFGGRLPFNPLVKAGVPVIITRNTPSKRLWNGCRRSACRSSSRETRANGICGTGTSG